MPDAGGLVPLWEDEIPNKIQPRDRFGFGGQWRGWRSAHFFEGNRQVCNVWWDDARRRANLNWTRNVGNANDWIAFSR